MLELTTTQVLLNKDSINSGMAIGWHVISMSHLTYTNLNLARMLALT